MSEVKKATTKKVNIYQSTNRAMVNKRRKLEKHCKSNPNDVEAHSALGSFDITSKSSRHGYQGPKRGFGMRPSGHLHRQLKKRVKNSNLPGFVVPTI